MRNDVFFAVATTLLAGVVAVLILWLDGQQTYLLAHFGEIPEGDAVETRSASETLSAEINPRIDYRTADRFGGGVLAVDDISQLARQLNSPDAPPERDLEILHTLIEFYQRANNGGIPPGGLNEEIVDALRGRNSKRLALLPHDLPAISITGELLDRWGTAYFFHSVSSSNLEIISAGPDRELGTPDDLGCDNADFDTSRSLTQRRR